MIMKKARLLAYYLPQFHPIPENDEWWGKGFTEWTNVAKAKPLFKGHVQPHLPADLGFYDLRLPEVRAAQAEMAQIYGIEGFCYYHYWFGDGRMLLERPFNEVLASGEPDFPFCLCWANENWSGVWFGETSKMLMEQRYSGAKDYEAHFNYLLPAFTDDRYIKVDGKPVFQILTPSNLPNTGEVTDIFRELAHKNGLKGLFLIAGYRCPEGWNPVEHGFDAVVSSKFTQCLVKGSSAVKSFTTRVLDSRFFVNNEKLHRALQGTCRVADYAELIECMKITDDYPFELYPSAVPNWDNTPRSGTRGFVVKDSTPKLWEEHLKDAVSYVQKYRDEHKIVFIKSWNEWAEGNYLEPDSVFGTQYLEAVKNCV
jgi:hypothetical protein